MTIIVREVEVTASNPYRTKYKVLGADLITYRVVVLHKRGSRNHKLPMQTIEVGNLLVIYQDRHTGAKWALRQG